MTITRRLFLRNSAAAGAVGTAVAPAVAEPREPDIQHFLDTASPIELAWYHALQLASAMDKLDETRAYRAMVDVPHGFAMVVGDPISHRTPVARVHIDDGSPLRADDVTGTTAYADWEARP